MVMCVRIGNVYEVYIYNTFELRNKLVNSQYRNLSSGIWLLKM